MTESKKCKCGSKDVIHDFMEKGIDAVQSTKCGSRWTVGFGEMSETSRFIVQKCGKEMESPPKMLEHIVLVHNDPDAAELLQEVQVAAYLQGLFEHQFYMTVR